MLWSLWAIDRDARKRGGLNDEQTRNGSGAGGGRRRYHVAGNRARIHVRVRPSPSRRPGDRGIGDPWRGRRHGRHVPHAHRDRRGAYLVTPATRRAGRRAGVLFVHWYQPPKATSSRKEFLPDAIDLATDGVVSLLVDTMWSNPKWFTSRDPGSDLGSSIEQVKELRRALDILASRPGVDPSRLFYVGHDFGAMYGALVAGEDAARLKAFVFMAGTQSFSDWFLLWPKRDAAASEAIISRLAPLDPTRHLARIGKLPTLFQFATRDKFVTKAAADALAASATGPKDVRWYDAEHELNTEATRDRLAWLRRKIRGR